MENDQNNRYSGFFSKKLRAGKRRTYFFDIKATKGNDYYLTITESKKRFNQPGYDSHKIFLYKEDFKKFMAGLEETVDHIKTELMPDFDYENFSREQYYEDNPPSNERSSNWKEEKTSETNLAEQEAEPLNEVKDETPEEPAVGVDPDISSEDAMEWS